MTQPMNPMPPGKTVSMSSQMPVAAAEYTVSRTYLDWLAILPWAKASRDRLDLKRVDRNEQRPRRRRPGASHQSP